MASNTMRAWLQTGFGDNSVRQLTEVPRPILATGEVLVKVAACALNRLDILQRKSPLLDNFKLPHIGGMDIAGTIVETESADDEHLIGTNVVLDPVVVCQTCDMCLDHKPMYCRNFSTMGSTRNGGFAEYVAAPLRNCIPVVDIAASLVELACVPVASVTAWHGLMTAGQLQSGETVVIPGGGSGLGVAGIQIAKSVGANVITLVSGQDKVKLAQQSGADLVIDRKACDWVEAVREYTQDVGVDFVWDHVGGPFLQQAINACKLDGRVVMSGTTAGNDSTIINTSLFHWGRKIIGHGGYTPEEMKEVIKLYSEGSLNVICDSQWSFEDLPAAEAKLESNDFFGKIVVYM
jgi:NADPH:quinone reductase-like Zn-dependent oxidoreductase